MSWYLNKALTTFRNEVNARWPNRDKTSDGTIGDAAHQQTNSDHNPDPDGSVDAWDIDVDGIDVARVIAAAVAHEATWYVIYNRRITSRSRSGGLGTWHYYDGPNPHDKHIHVNTREAFETSVKPWLTAIVIVPVVPKPPVLTWEDKLIMDLPTVQLGSTGSLARTAQGLLNARGFTTTIDGNFGPHSRTQTLAMQKKFGAEGLDGKWGPETWTIGMTARDTR